jgi:hypothetical protein
LLTIAGIGELTAILALIDASETSAVVAVEATFNHDCHGKFVHRRPRRNFVVQVCHSASIGGVTWLLALARLHVSAFITASVARVGCTSVKVVRIGTGESLAVSIFGTNVSKVSTVSTAAYNDLWKEHTG